MLLLEEKTKRIIGCFYEVYNILGYGFLEKVYENSLLIDLRNNGFNCFQQSSVAVYYKSFEVGLYFPDIVIDNEIILELKAGEGGIKLEHELQLMNYLKATEFEVGLIFHFGKTPTFKRKIFTRN
jgi:GxxExxY protein